ncbi:lysozyme inhibitor LprI family protein [Psychrobacter immobilis]|jgi:uncharacterized protein YecT (DUF1311 family)|uniref:lysozyme inhibitor LprI family protein n=1 Tax=Psychrobacter immobilis TaxID=498 RepID=UPI001918A5D8|nr:lysozyme inhibitor LprI family protein [Psychrobacter immobilis]
MKYLISFLSILILTSVFSISFAGPNKANSIVQLKIKNEEIKKKIAQVYYKNYQLTDYKNIFEKSQINWISYRDSYCKDYIGSEASASQGIGSELLPLECLVNLNQDRLNELSRLPQ